MEKKIILEIGRKENGGTLTNMSDGGEGQSGYNHTTETKNKISKSINSSKKWRDIVSSSDFSKKVSDGLIGHKGAIFEHTEKTKKELSEIQIGEKNSFFGKSHSSKQKKKWSENRKGNKNSNAIKYTIITPENIKIIFEGKHHLKEYFNKINSDKNLKGPNRISCYNLIIKGESKNYILYKKEKLNSTSK